MKLLLINKIEVVSLFFLIKPKYLQLIIIIYNCIILYNFI